MFSCKKIINSTKVRIKKNDIFQKMGTKKNQLLDWVEVHPWKTLMIIFFISIGIKIAFSWLILTPVAPSDEYRYLKMAESFWHGRGFQVYGMPSHNVPPLYPIIISPAYIFSDMMYVAGAINIINALVSSLIIFPAFLISREFLDERKSIVIVVLVSISGCGIGWFFKILSQNLWCPLLLFTIYILYKAALEEGYKFKILGGVFVGLCFLSKYNSVVLFPFILIIFLINSFYIKNDKHSKLFRLANGIKDSLIIGLVSGIVITPWFIRNGSIFGYTVEGILGYTSNVESVRQAVDYIVSGGSSFYAASTMPGDFLIQTILLNGLIIYACGIIFFVLSLIMLYRSFKNRERDIFLLSIMIFLLAEFLIFLTAWHNGCGHRPWRTLHAYIQPAIMPFIILGYMGLVKIKNISNRSAILVTMFCIIPLIFFLKALFPVLSTNLSLLGLKIDAIEPLFWVISIAALIIIFAVFMFFLRYKPLKNRKYIVILASLLIISFTMFTSIKYINRTYYEIPSHPLNDVGRWMNDHVSGTNDVVFFDKNMGCYNIERPQFTPLAIFIGSWINAPIIVGDTNNITENSRYLISFEQFDYEVLYNKSIPLRSANISSIPQTQTLYVYSINNASK